MAPKHGDIRNPVFSSEVHMRSPLSWIFIPILLIPPLQAQVETPAYRNPKLSIGDRVSDLLARMTLEEKVDQITGGHRKNAGVVAKRPTARRREWEWRRSREQGPTLLIDRHHVLATAKHFAAHGQPESRTNTAPANYSERVLRESFLVPFEAAVKEARVGSVMASYNEIDGIPSNVNLWLLDRLLRQEWRLPG